MSDIPPEEFRNIEDMLKKILTQAFGTSQMKPGLVGVNIIVAGGLPGGPGGSVQNPGRDIEHPEIEITEWDGRLIVTCELRGLSDENVKVALAEGALHIIGFDGKIRYRNSAPIPPVVEASCTRTFENGVLELTYLLRHDQGHHQDAEPVSDTLSTSGEDSSSPLA